jgi:hypothetical protein
MRRRDEVVYRSSSNVVIDVDGRSNERGGGRRERDGRGRTRGKEAVVESRLGRGGVLARREEPHRRIQRAREQDAFPGNETRVVVPVPSSIINVRIKMAWMTTIRAWRLRLVDDGRRTPRKYRNARRPPRHLPRRRISA